MNNEVFMSAEFLRDASTDELKALITEQQQILLALRTDKSVCRFAQRPHLFGASKRLIARAKTILRERGSN